MADTHIILEVVAKTNTGMVREANEDNFIVTDDYKKTKWILPKGEYSNSIAGTLMLVADGMGGTNAGEVASQVVVESVQDFFSRINAVIENAECKSAMTDSIIKANEDIINHSKTNPQTEGMGSTVVMSLIKGKAAHIAWVGDSRCYIFRNEKIQQLSKDHSYVQSLVDQGKLTKEEAFHHPESNIITQSLGDSGRIPKPDYCTLTLLNNDLLLMCSDGLNGMLQDEEIAMILNDNKDNITTAVDQLIDKANEAGGTDNISVILAKIISGGAEREEGGYKNPFNNTENKKPSKKGLKYLLGAGLIAVIIFLFLHFSSSGISSDPVTPAVVKPDSAQKNKNEVGPPAQHKDSVVNTPGNSAIIPKEKEKRSKDSASNRQKKPDPGKAINNELKNHPDTVTPIIREKVKDLIPDDGKPRTKDTSDKHQTILL